MLGTQLLKVIQESAKPPSSETTEMLLGVVTSTSPLVVRVDNRYDLTEDFLLLTTLVQDFDVDMTVNHMTEVASHAPHAHGYVGRAHEIVKLNIASERERPQPSVSCLHRIALYLLP